MVHNLISKQAAVDAADKDGMTALCAAAVRGHTACATELLTGHANVNARLNVGFCHLSLNQHCKHPAALFDLSLAKNLHLQWQFASER